MSQPEELGIDPNRLSEIDSIVNRSIADGVFPGCQVVVAVEGKIIYKKSFGYHTYDEKREVKDTDIYDIASITKVAASTLSLMKLDSEGKFDLSLRLENYLPDLTAGTSYSSIRLKDMMAHQAGLFPWIPFYTETLNDHKLNMEIYHRSNGGGYSTPVANNLWIKDGYEKLMYDHILKTPLKSRRYKYSDLGYYFVKKIIQKQSGQPIDEYTYNTFYKPMGLRYMRYNPLKYFDLDQIPPTENDTIFRKQLVHGYVHDQGAAMMGGVGGHAGLFSNATDLASVMQLFLNGGEYGTVRYIDKSVIDQYTAYQFYPKNRRGAGFDKPTTNGKGGPTCNLVSKKSFGHSGFTGTLTWADPEYGVNFVFLSNRVYPDAENWKIVRRNVRTDIQKVIYEAVLNAKK
jgi:CubicO group peptidase (beta-lactamase class C family)